MTSQDRGHGPIRVEIRVASGCSGILACILLAGCLFYRLWASAIFAGLVALALIAAAIPSGRPRPGTSAVSLARKATRLRAWWRNLLLAGLLGLATLALAPKIWHLSPTLFLTPFNKFVLTFFTAIYIGGLVALGLYSYRLEQYKSAILDRREESPRNAEDGPP
jgi:hypothetical protein